MYSTMIDNIACSEYVIQTTLILHKPLDDASFLQVVCIPAMFSMFTLFQSLSTSSEITTHHPPRIKKREEKATFLVRLIPDSYNCELYSSSC